MDITKSKLYLSLELNVKLLLLHGSGLKFGWNDFPTSEFEMAGKQKTTIAPGKISLRPVTLCEIHFSSRLSEDKRLTFKSLV